MNTDYIVDPFTIKSSTGDEVILEGFDAADLPEGDYTRIWNTLKYHAREVSPVTSDHGYVGFAVWLNSRMVLVDNETGKWSVSLFIYERGVWEEIESGLIQFHSRRHLGELIGWLSRG